MLRQNARPHRVASRGSGPGTANFLGNFSRSGSITYCGEVENL